MTRSRKTLQKQEAIDCRVAERVREIRYFRGLSQAQLGRTMGISPQQVHKYEKGISRISAGTLFDISQALHIPISYFFEEISEKSKLSNNKIINVVEIRDSRHIEALHHLTRVLAER